MDPEMIRLQEEEAQERADAATVAEAVRNAARNGSPVDHLSDEDLASDLVRSGHAFGADQARALAAVRAWRERAALLQGT